MAAPLDQASRRFSFVLADGTEVFPVSVDCQDDCAPLYRVSLGRRGGHVLISAQEVNELTMLHKVIYEGYAVRCAFADGTECGLYRHSPKPSEGEPP